MTDLSKAVPEKGDDGIWRVAEAYRWLDRQCGEPISRAEDVSAWVQRQELAREWASD
jgi:hypothetical protein